MKPAAFLLVLCSASLLALGLVILYSSGMGTGTSHYLLRQSVWAAAGLTAAGVIAFSDYRLLKHCAWPLLILSIGLLVLVLFPQIGILKNGARRWMGAGGFVFQPSEFAKVSLIIFLAHYGSVWARHMSTFWRGLVIPSSCCLIVLGLIFVEPDRGTTILLAGVSGVMLLLGGTRWSFILPPGLAGIAAVTLSLLNDPVRQKRIFGWLNIEETKSGVSYQAYQAMVALGSGGWTGLGLGNSRQKLGFLPEHHTDFIFSVIGEELGLIGTLAVVLVFICFVSCGVYIAWNSGDHFGLLLGAGLSFLIGMQALINIGVVTSALPNKGLPLPFISYGGSNLFMMLVSVGILLSIAHRAPARKKSLTRWQREHGPDAPQFA